MNGDSKGVRWIRRIIRELTPPVALRILGMFQRPKNLTLGLFRSYREAEAECSRGYQDPRLIDLIHEKGKIRRDSFVNRPLSAIIDEDPKLLYALVKVFMEGRALRVLDFGGGFGLHYYPVKTILGASFPMQWNIVETDEMVRRSSDFATNELKFFTDMDKAKEDLGEIDLLYSSGAIQYTPDPIRFLRNCLALKPRVVYLTRWLMTEETTGFITIQQSLFSHNGAFPGLPPGFSEGVVKYPLVVVCKSHVIDEFKASYDVVLDVRQGENTVHVAGREVNYYRFLAQLK